MDSKNGISYEALTAPISIKTGSYSLTPQDVEQFFEENTIAQEYMFTAAVAGWDREQQYKYTIFKVSNANDRTLRQG